MIVMLILVMIGGLAITAVASQKTVLPGLVVLVVASIVSFIPGLPRFELEPHVIMTLVIPPLIYSAAIHFSLQSFLRHFRPIIGLGVLLVVVTTFVVAYLTHWLIPTIGLATAFVIAAVVSPPDSVTTVVHGKEIGLPRKVVAVLMGESLINDATALTIFTLVIAHVTGSHPFISNPVLLFVYGAIVGVFIGGAIGMAAVVIRTHTADATLESTIGLLVPFAAYLMAEEVHASGILAVVMAGFTVSVNSSFDFRHHTPTTYRTRLQEAELWPVVDALLETFVFAYMGLQLSHVVDDLQETNRSTTNVLAAGVVVLLVVIGVRFAWVFLVYGEAGLGARLKRWTSRLPKPTRERKRKRIIAKRQSTGYITWQEKVLVSWSGPRGLVTLAVAASVPLTMNGEPFPGRETIQIVAFIVTIGTLLLQTTTLGLVARLLHIDLSAEQRAEEAELAAGVAMLASYPPTAFQDRRVAISYAVANGDFDDEIGHILLIRTDLEEAAVHAQELN